MHKEVSNDLNFVDREKEVLEFWKENDIFNKSINLRNNNQSFAFYDGPPTANGKPHIGHILTRVMKDIIPRYKTMKGYKVLRKAGWDTHGLPVELEVEKKLGIEGKPGIEKYGIEPFINNCKESVWKYEKEWRNMSERVGFWADMDNPYVTYHNEYIESVWWALKEIWNKGLLYKGHKVVPYCPRCGTSLSSHEVAQGYKDVKEKSIFVKFAVKSQENVFLMAWTTTPWTLPSNVSLCVNPEVIYAKVKCNNEVYILAEPLMESVLKHDYEVLEKMKGKDLEGLEYEPLFNFADVKEKAFYVTAGDFVTLTDGTGIVHIAPAFGEDDAKIGKEYQLPFVQLVNEQGKFIDCVKPWKNIFVKDADPEIIKDLTARNLIYNDIEYEHSYPFCWRCDTPLLYYARDTWFIKMSDVRDKLLKNNNLINWLPEYIKDGRFGNFLENVIDWGLSRERYWGTPLPIWECTCGYRHVVGSIKELKNMGKDVPEDIELHKPYIDKVKLVCPECRSDSMKRVTEVIDCWFDSGSMPFAQWHYPFENTEVFKENFPADFISEALDQTRGWFYTLLAISTILFDNTAYKNVIVLGLVQDKDGQKMSKHKGNVIDPWTVLEKQGADAVRWYFYTSSAPWLPSRFYDDAVSEAQRKFMGKLWNSYGFYVLYANIDGIYPAERKIEKNNLLSLDRWILSKLNTLIEKVDMLLEQYRITESARAIQDFTDDLSNWYVRRSRERFWKNAKDNDKLNAYTTMYTVLSTIAKLSAPYIPFMAEDIYQNLVRAIEKEVPLSVHLCDFPVSDKTFIDKDLEKSMDLVLKIVVQGRACRNTAGIKNRQPLSKIYVKAEYKLEEEFKQLVADELNLKEIVFTDDTGNFNDYKFKPQLKTIGPRYGKLLPKISQELANVNGIEAMQKLKNGESIRFNIDGTDITLAIEDVIVEETQMPGYVTEDDGGVIVVLDTNLTPELVEEGFVREIVSKIQTMRKDAGFEVQDNIEVYHENNDKIAEIIEKNITKISEEVLAKGIYNKSGEGFKKEWKINGQPVTLTVKKV